MTELTPQDIVELFAVGTGVSASIALLMEQAIAPYLRMLVKPWRQLSLRLAPLVLGIVLTHLLFPVAVLYLTPIEHEWMTWRVTVPLGIIGGAGATYAYDVWQGIVKTMLERWVKGDG